MNTRPLCAHHLTNAITWSMRTIYRMLSHSIALMEEQRVITRHREGNDYPVKCYAAELPNTRQLTAEAARRTWHWRLRRYALFLQDRLTLYVCGSLVLFIYQELEERSRCGQRPRPPPPLTLSLTATTITLAFPKTLQWKGTPSPWKG